MLDVVLVLVELVREPQRERLGRNAVVRGPRDLGEVALAERHAPRELAALLEIAAQRAPLLLALARVALRPEELEAEHVVVVGERARGRRERNVERLAGRDGPPSGLGRARRLRGAVVGHVGGREARKVLEPRALAPRARVALVDVDRERAARVGHAQRRRVERREVGALLVESQRGRAAGRVGRDLLDAARARAVADEHAHVFVRALGVLEGVDDDAEAREARADAVQLGAGVPLAAALATREPHRQAVAEERLALAGDPESHDRRELAKGALRDRDGRDDAAALALAIGREADEILVHDRVAQHVKVGHGALAALRVDKIERGRERHERVADAGARERRDGEARQDPTLGRHCLASPTKGAQQ